MPLNEKDIERFLAESEYINWRETAVFAKAKELSHGLKSDEAIARACFEFVRDHIHHSSDYQRNPITCKASDALTYQTGYCYAKSHLLAALLRANAIPAALCYQRLTITDQPPYCLHGLNAVYLERFGWYRLDARGNKPGVNAQFYPPVEQLAFSSNQVGECLFDTLMEEPHEMVVQALLRHRTWQDLYNNLPDSISV